MGGIVRTCPECNEPLEHVAGWEMGSAPRRFRCIDCQIAYEVDASGLLTEVDD